LTDKQPTFGYEENNLTDEDIEEVITLRSFDFLKSKVDRHLSLAFYLHKIKIAFIFVSSK